MRATFHRIIACALLAMVVVAVVATVMTSGGDNERAYGSLSRGDANCDEFVFPSDAWKQEIRGTSLSGYAARSRAAERLVACGSLIDATRDRVYSLLGQGRRSIGGRRSYLIGPANGSEYAAFNYRLNVVFGRSGRVTRVFISGSG